MKKHIKLFSSISLFLVLSLPVISKAAGADEEVRKKRTINKSYNVGPDDKLEIENQFGNVQIDTWDKSQITVDITIGVRASSEEKAKEIMDEIDVKEIQSGHIINFKTKVGEIHNNEKKEHRGSGDDDRSFYIDYVIHMPSGNRLNVENSFGKLEIGDFKGLVALTSKFGSLKTGILDNVDNIDVEFGRAYISEVTNGKVVFKFNKESKIGKVNGKVKISSEFSHNVLFNVSEDIQDLAVYESYSDMRMVLPKGLSAHFDVHTSFGSFHNDSEFNIREKREGDNDNTGPRFDKDYSGQAGDGKASIKIKSSFGNVRLTYPGAPDIKEKDKKDKDKDKDKDKEDKDDDEKTS
jgi:hypothetical protein